MTLIVRTPPGYEAERRWILDVVVGRWWGLQWEHRSEARTDVRIELAGATDDGGVRFPDVLFATPEARWLTPASLPPAAPWRPVGAAGAVALGQDERLPVLFGRAAPTHDTAVVDLGDPDTALGMDVLGAAFFMLSRYEEVVLPDRDGYDRFPSSASVAHRDGFTWLPVVDAWVELLWLACSRRWPRLRRREEAYRVHLSHDVDDPLSTIGRTPYRVARQLAGDVVRRRDPGLLLRRVRALPAARRGEHEADPHNTFEFLMDVSDRHALRSSFYFLAHNDVDPQGPPYRLVDHPWVRSLIGRVHRRGHEVGLHAAFGTYLDVDRTAEEFAHLRRVAEAQGVEQGTWGGRQHYLQWRNPVTWRNWSAAGLDQDATVGFGDTLGFRTGTSRAYPVFDLVERQALTLEELPFQVMDVAVADDRSAPPEHVHRDILGIARQCHRFGGTLGILWHNDEVLRTTRQQDWYAALVADLCAVR